MTKRRLLISAVAGFIFSATGSAFESYPLSCRGGGGTLGYDSARKTALMYFQKASGPAGVGLAVGQCSWVDRAIGGNEPPCLRQFNVETHAWIFPGGSRAQSYFNSSSAPWLRSLLDANQYQTFQVYNPGDGNCFNVTRLGP